MNKKQLRELIVEATLHRIPLYSDEAVLAIMMIIAHESKKGAYIKQLGNGPALGLIQMEPETHASVWKEGDSVWKNALFAGIISRQEYGAKLSPPATRLIHDLNYNVFMARQRLFMKPEKLPTTTEEMSVYLKKHWNSAAGKATNTSYQKAYETWH
jgi:hypothetical protein